MLFIPIATHNCMFVKFIPHVHVHSLLGTWQVLYHTLCSLFRGEGSIDQWTKISLATDRYKHTNTMLSKNVVAVSIKGWQRKFEFTILIYHLDNGQRNYKPEIKHAERMILPSSSQKYLQKKMTKSDFWQSVSQLLLTQRYVCNIFLLLSLTKLLTNIAFKVKQLLSYFTHRTTSLSS